jgi:RES domain-containing protein
MTHRRLPDSWKAYRIGDPEGAWPIWDPGGARRAAGRWHEAGAEVIYASRSYATTMLEKLVHYSGTLPPNQHFIEIDISAGVSYEVVNPDALPGWASADGTIARRFGEAWHDELRSALLVVPSVVARMESNLVFNARHPDFRMIKPGLETPVWWDARLFDPS